MCTVKGDVLLPSILQGKRTRLPETPQRSGLGRPRMRSLRNQRKICVKDLNPHNIEDYIAHDAELTGYFSFYVPKLLSAWCHTGCSQCSVSLEPHAQFNILRAYNDAGAVYMYGQCRVCFKEEKFRSTSVSRSDPKKARKVWAPGQWHAQMTLYMYLRSHHHYHRQVACAIHLCISDVGGQGLNGMPCATLHLQAN